MKTYILKIGWLYPELMSTYGDRGNITVLQKRCEWRGIKTEMIPIDQTSIPKTIQEIDILFGGGAQDREQELVMQHLAKLGPAIKKRIDENMPALFVCGAPQLMGNYYEPAEGKRIEGLGIFDMISKHPGADKPRLIGNLIAEACWTEIDPSFKKETDIIVGFENHGGRTYLGKNARPFAQVLKGNGNNGEDGTEGVVYNHAIGCYLHGPLLPKNPVIADYLITKAIEVKYGEKITLEKLDDSLAEKAKAAIR